eukprot:878264-Rhodomonas_salina.2
MQLAAEPNLLPAFNSWNIPHNPDGGLPYQSFGFQACMCAVCSSLVQQLGPALGGSCTALGGRGAALIGMGGPWWERSCLCGRGTASVGRGIALKGMGGAPGGRGTASGGRGIALGGKGVALGGRGAAGAAAQREVEREHERTHSLERGRERENKRIQETPLLPQTMDMSWCHQPAGPPTSTTSVVQTGSCSRDLR